MPQYWSEILDVLAQSSYSSSVDLATTPFLLITLMVIMCTTRITGKHMLTKHKPVHVAALVG